MHNLQISPQLDVDSNQVKAMLLRAAGMANGLSKAMGEDSDFYIEDAHLVLKGLAQTEPGIRLIELLYAQVREGPISNRCMRQLMQQASQT